MRLTFALGLQFDNGQSAAYSSKPKERRSPDPVAQSDPVIDVSIVSQAAAPAEVSNHFSVFFLTYNLHGLPDPVLNGGVSVDLFA
ncbi:MAG: hypothetical protein AUJ57_10065 [Zetaproteobacteria bacterium CG1_02_53_45]|nr:MAG: hypothetical protein AUJ57_10065 [Zetaproteobacteria bacterium CG1_02_53_45]